MHVDSHMCVQELIVRGETISRRDTTVGQQALETPSGLMVSPANRFFPTPMALGCTCQPLPHNHPSNGRSPLLQGGKKIALQGGESFPTPTPSLVAVPGRILRVGGLASQPPGSPGWRNHHSHCISFMLCTFEMK